MEYTAAVIVGLLLANGVLSDTTLSAIDNLVASLVALAGAVATTVVWRLVEKYLPSKGDTSKPAADKDENQQRKDENQ